MSDSDHFPDLVEKLQAIRERIRQRAERPAPTVVSLPPGEPLKEHLRAAENLAGAIGTVNPRPPGLVNSLLQTFKRSLASLGDWQFRPQRQFNREVAGSLDEVAGSLSQIAQSMESLQAMLAALRQDLDREQNDICEQITQQRWSYEGALMRQTQGLQEFREELQQLRQRVANQAKVQAARPATGAEAAATAPAAVARSTTPIEIDYLALERDFRGSEQEINRRQRFYLPFFEGRRNVLDIACGRGEFLELMREAGVAAKGVDLDADMVGRCLEKGLDVKQSDVFAYLAQVPDGSLDGVFSAQFVEHLEAGDYLRLIAQCVGKLAPGGVLAIETQNPECLAIFSQSFYIDPTHVRPIPPAQLRYAFANAGLGKIATYPLSPAAAVLPVLPKLPAGAADADALRAFNAAVEKFNDTFFGGMDYAVIGYRPGA